MRGGLFLEIDLEMRLISFDMDKSCSHGGMYIESCLNILG